MPLRFPTALQGRSARFWLVLLVVVSAALRLAEGAFEGSPVLYPDEYIYAALARSFASAGLPLIRGGTSHFPAVLEPALTAPFWWLHGVAAPYHAILALNSVVMSMSAIPVYLLARRVALTERLGLVVAGLTLLSPDLVYATGVLAEPFAFPLALTAFYFMVEAIAEPRVKAQLGFIGFSALAIICRLQFVALPAAYLLAMLLVAARTRELRNVWKQHAVPLAVCLVPAAAVGTFGASRFLGFYKGATALNGSVIGYVAAAGRELLVLGYISGWIVIPGALLGIAFAFWKPINRQDLAFAAGSVAFGSALLSEAAIYGVAGRVQERYFYYVVPVILIAFGTYVKRGWPARPLQAVIAALFLGAAFLAPTISYLPDHNNDGSPFLLGAHWLVSTYYVAGSPLLILILCAATLTALGTALVSSRRATAAAFSIAAALITCFAVLAGAFYYQNSSHVQLKESWIDSFKYQHVTAIYNPGTRRLALFVQMFWNRSLNQLATMPLTTPPDVFRTEKASVSGNGTFLLNGKPAREVPLLIDSYQTYAHFKTLRPVAQHDQWLLYPPTKNPRLSVYMTGFYSRGYLGLSGSAVIWPDKPGFFEITLSADQAQYPAHLTWRTDSAVLAKVTVKPKTNVLLKFPVCNSPHGWQVSFQATGTGLGGATMIIGSDLLSVQATPPHFVADSTACKASSAASASR